MKLKHLVFAGSLAYIAYLLYKSSHSKNHDEILVDRTKAEDTAFSTFAPLILVI